MFTIEYAAGLFEGEGYIRNVLRDQRKYKPLAEISVDMTDLDVIQNFLSALDLDDIRITTKQQPKAHHRPLYRASITGRQRVADALSKMLPYFGQRRAYAALNTLDLIDGCL